MAGLCGFPPISQKARNGWGTEMMGKAKQKVL
jgi:hypothetical protein